MPSGQVNNDQMMEHINASFQRTNDPSYMHRIAVSKYLNLPGLRGFWGPVITSGVTVSVPSMYQAFVQPEMGYNQDTATYLDMDVEPDYGLEFKTGIYTWAKGRFATPVGYTGDLTITPLFWNGYSTGDVVLDTFVGVSEVGDPPLNTTYDSGNLIITLGTQHVIYAECPITTACDADGAVVECQFARVGDDEDDTYADSIYLYGWRVEWV